MGSFEVVGAIRQSGQITLMSNEDWRSDWVLGPAVRRIMNPEGIETNDERRPLATFQYFRQPCRLEIEPRQQETRISMHPQLSHACRRRSRDAGSSIRLQVA